MAQDPNSTSTLENNSMDSKGLEAVNDHNSEDDDDVFVLQARPVLSRKGNSSKSSISVESYSEDEDLRRDITIRASLIPEAKGSSSLSRKNIRVIDLTQDYGHDDDDVHVIDSDTITKRTKRQVFSGESSNSKSKTNDDNMHDSVEGAFTCDICVDEKPKAELFYVKGCSHFYCSGCIVKYVDSKVQENIINITCPVLGCNGRLEPEYCLSILPSQLFDRWGDALCEAAILSSEKFYCPYRDCSAFLIDDGWEGTEAITHCDCPNCRRRFCAKCRVPWHSEISCEEFQDLNRNEREKEDIVLMNLAESKQWKRCPKCKFYVEKSSGCIVIRCRCGCSFCYGCGGDYVNGICSCANSLESMPGVGSSRIIPAERSRREALHMLTRRARARSSRIYQAQNMRRARAGSSNASQTESSMADVFDTLSRSAQMRSSSIYRVENRTRARTGSSSAIQVENRRRARMGSLNSQVESSRGDVFDMLTRSAQMGSSSVNQREDMTRARAGSSVVSQVESSKGDVFNMLTGIAQMGSSGVNQGENMRRAQAGSSSIYRLESVRSDIFNMFRINAQTGSSSTIQVDNTMRAQAGSSSVNQGESSRDNMLNIRSAQIRSSRINLVENVMGQFRRKV